jgi:hypothetical protein
MKVAPDSTGVSALDTWLRDVGAPAGSPGQGPVAGTNLASTVSSASVATQQLRDPAEDLLMLDVWSGRAPGQLRPADVASLSEGDATVQHWAEHIFSPLR